MNSPYSLTGARLRADFTHGAGGLSAWLWLGALLACLWLAPSVRLVAADASTVPAAEAGRLSEALDQVGQDLDEAERLATSVEEALDWGRKPKATREEIEAIGESVVLRRDEVVPQVVVVQGSATIDGVVTGDVVVISGKARINGTVWGNVVNVGRGVVLGSGARVRGDAVGVLGGVRLGPDSLIGGDAVGVIGGIKKQPGARVLGEEVLPVSFGPLSGPDGLDLPEWLTDAVMTSFKELVLLGRPLSLQVGWVWAVLAVFMGIYLLFGLLMVPLVPLVLIILAGTGVLLMVVPFVAAAVFLAGLLGKAALLLFLGQAIGRQFKAQLPPLVAILLGGALLAGLYLVPFLGLLLLKVTDMWALGAAMVALFIGLRRERPQPEVAAAGPVPPRAPEPVFAATPATATAPSATVDSVAAVTQVTPEETPATPLFGAAPGAAAAIGATAGAFEAPPAFAEMPATPEALTLPRVGFKDRFLATCIDWLILAMICGPLGLMSYFMLLFPAYFAAMWVWKQTTVGGTVLRLKVVRTDGRRLDWPTAVVRALGALFGSVAAGLGYFWAGWDAEKQGWHDKIAGTVVVKTEQVRPLV